MAAHVRHVVLTLWLVTAGGMSGHCSNLRNLVIWRLVRGASAGMPEWWKAGMSWPGLIGPWMGRPRASRA